MPFLREEMTEVVTLYSKLRNTITIEEAKKLQPHLKAVAMLLREMDSKHRIQRVQNKVDDMQMYITGELKKIEEE